MKPYGYVRADGSGIFIYGTDKFEPPQDVELVPVYLARDWVELTDKHVFEVLENLQKIYHRPPSMAFAKAIEAKLKELNT